MISTEFRARQTNSNNKNDIQANRNTQTKNNKIERLKLGTSSSQLSQDEALGAKKYILIEQNFTLTEDSSSRNRSAQKINLPDGIRKQIPKQNGYIFFSSFTGNERDASISSALIYW